MTSSFGSCNAKMDGTETLNRLKHLQHCPNINTPVVMFTSGSENDTKDDVVKLGFTDILFKPVKENEIIVLIQTLVSQKIGGTMHKILHSTTVCLLYLLLLLVPVSIGIASYILPHTNSGYNNGSCLYMGNSFYLADSSTDKRISMPLYPFKKISPMPPMKVFCPQN